MGGGQPTTADTWQQCASSKQGLEQQQSLAEAGGQQQEAGQQLSGSNHLTPAPPPASTHPHTHTHTPRGAGTQVGITQHSQIQLT